MPSRHSKWCRAAEDTLILSCDRKEIPAMSTTIVKIISRQSGKVLEIRGRSKERRAAIEQSSFTGGAHQLWEIVHTSRDGRVKIVSRHSELIMTPNGTPVQQYDDLNVPAQQWRFEQVEDGYLALISVEN